MRYSGVRRSPLRLTGKASFNNHTAFQRISARPGHSGRATPGLVSIPEVKPAALGLPVWSERPCRGPKPGSGHKAVIHALKISFL